MVPPEGKHTDFAMKTVKIGAAVGMVASCAMIVTAHSSAVEVSQEQPTKLAMMEACTVTKCRHCMHSAGLTRKTSRSSPVRHSGRHQLPGNGHVGHRVPGLNSLAQTDKYADVDVANMPVNLVFQSYHLMVAMYGLIMLTVILALVFTLRGGRIRTMRWLQKLLVVAPLFPLIAIQVAGSPPKLAVSRGWCIRRRPAPTAWPC